MVQWKMAIFEPGNDYWRGPFLTSMIMGGSAKTPTKSTFWMMINPQAACKIEVGLPPTNFQAGAGGCSGYQYNDVYRIQYV